MQARRRYSTAAKRVAEAVEAAMHRLHRAISLLRLREVAQVLQMVVRRPVPRVLLDPVARQQDPVAVLQPRAVPVPELRQGRSGSPRLLGRRSPREPRAQDRSSAALLVAPRTTTPGPQAKHRPRRHHWIAPRRPPSRAHRPRELHRKRLRRNLRVGRRLRRRSPHRSPEPTSHLKGEKRHVRHAGGNPAPGYRPLLRVRT